ncbi:MAG TPA: extracellular solute-binding protein, partial [Micromonosporaceae bacterium]|nr:extracellular solute-binding protein [Micromonosporaceae bacterium]
MRTKILLLPPLVLLLVAAPAGCGRTQDGPAGATDRTGELVIWADDKRTAALTPFLDRFEQALGAKVRLHTVTGDGQASFVTAVQQGTGPDVTIGAHDWIGNLVRNGTIEPIRLTDAQRDAYTPAAVDAVTFDGRIYGVPYAVENLALIRNVDLAPTAPATVEDLVTAGRRLVARGLAGEALCLQVGQNGDGYHIFPLFNSGGGYLLGTDADGDYDAGDIGVDEPGSIAAFTRIRALGEQGLGVLRRSIGPENATNLFTRRQCPYLIAGPWAVPDVKAAGFPYAIDPIPGFRGGRPARPFLGVQAFYVAAGGDNRLLAQTFVTEFTADPDLAVALYEADPRPPALTAALVRVADGDPDAARFLAAGEGGPPLPGLPAMPAIWETFGKAEAAIIGGADVAGTLRAAA